MNVQEKRSQGEHETLGSRLKALMKERGVNQQALADNVGVVRQAISRYCRDEATPDTQILINIAKFFGTSTDYLLGNSQSRVNADVLEVKLRKLDADALKKITALMQGDADAGLEYINILLGTDAFYKALVYLNTACKIKRLKDIEPSEQSKAYMDAVKITNAFESTSEVIASANRVIKSYIDDATEVMGKVFRDIVDGKEV